MKRISRIATRANFSTNKMTKMTISAPRSSWVLMTVSVTARGDGAIRAPPPPYLNVPRYADMSRASRSLTPRSGMAVPGFSDWGWRSHSLM